jgi:hypothetical protein
VLVALAGLDGVTTEDQVEPDVDASVAWGGVAPSEPVVPSPWERHVIWRIPGHTTPSAVKVDVG